MRKLSPIGGQRICDYELDSEKISSDVPVHINITIAISCYRPPSLRRTQQCVKIYECICLNQILGSSQRRCYIRSVTDRQIPVHSVNDVKEKLKYPLEDEQVSDKRFKAIEGTESSARYKIPSYSASVKLCSREIWSLCG